MVVMITEQPEGKIERRKVLHAVTSCFRIWAAVTLTSIFPHLLQIGVVFLFLIV